MTSTESFIESIYQSREVITASGKRIPLHSELQAEEGLFLKNLILQHGCTQSVETGFAYGLSSLHICNATHQNSSQAHHTVIDPHQHTQWEGTGMANLERAGFAAACTLVEKPSELALPALLEAGKQFDFALIDGWHTFDHTLLDFFYLNRMLKVGGVIAIDDVPLPAINKVVRYIMNYPCYRPAGNAAIRYAPKRRFFMAAKRWLSPLAGAFPFRNHLFDQALLKPDQAIGLQSSMIAFVKIAEDTRNWDWYEPF